MDPVRVRFGHYSHLAQGAGPGTSDAAGDDCGRRQPALARLLCLVRLPVSADLASGA